MLIGSPKLTPVGGAEHAAGLACRCRGRRIDAPPLRDCCADHGPAGHHADPARYTVALSPRICLLPWQLALLTVLSATGAEIFEQRLQELSKNTDGIDTGGMDYIDSWAQQNAASTPSPAK